MAAPDRLVVTGRRSHYLAALFLGCAMLGSGLVWCSLVLGVGWLFATSSGRSDPSPPPVAVALQLGPASFDFLIALSAGAVLLLVGSLQLLDAWHLGHIRLVIDHRGISREDGHRLTMPWDQIRHVAVTYGAPGWRRLLVDHGTLPASWWRRSRVDPGLAALRLLPGLRGFAVNILVDRLNVSAGRVVDAIHYYSGGRFPDTWPR